MGRFDPERVDRFARLLASGISIRAAATAAGYKLKSNACYRMAKLPHFKERLAKYQLEFKHAGSRDLRPIVVILMEGGEKAFRDGTAASLASAARLLAEAARLKARLPAWEKAGGEKGDSEAEWAARFGPSS